MNNLKKQRVEQVQNALNTTLSGLKDDSWLTQRVLHKARSSKHFSRKVSFSFIFALLFILMIVTALAVGLNHYFEEFSGLEKKYGEYEKWSSGIKVELVQIMIENDIVPEEYVEEIKNCTTLKEREQLAESILDSYFDNTEYIDTYSVMERELGAFETWTEEDRAYYISLLKKNNQYTDSWPIYSVPQKDAIGREDAIKIAKSIILQKYIIEEDQIDSVSINSIFQIDPHNQIGITEDVPFWTVEFGDGIAYRVYLTKEGKTIATQSPGTPLIFDGWSYLDNTTSVLQGENDSSAEDAILSAQSALTEIENISQDEVDQMRPITHFIIGDIYESGMKPVWIVTWYKNDTPAWEVLLDYSSKFIDAVPEGKLFSRVCYNDYSFEELCQLNYSKYKIADPYGEITYYDWSLENKKKYYEVFSKVVSSYSETHPYFNGTGYPEWDFTRNISDIPEDSSISEETARQIASDTLIKKLGEKARVESLKIFYYTTNPSKPEWRFANSICGIIIDADTGDVLQIQDKISDSSYTIIKFLSFIL